jgi:hypothetical protein
MARKKRKDAVDVIEVWIGYSDDKPHIVEPEPQPNFEAMRKLCSGDPGNG